MALLSFKRSNHKRKTMKPFLGRKQKLANSGSNNTASTAGSKASQVASDVPVNINVQQKERRRNGLARSGPSQQMMSTFSIMSRGGMSAHLHNPYLEDDDEYANYDINEELKEDTYNSEIDFSYSDRFNSDRYREEPTMEDEAEEASFFAANPLPFDPPAKTNTPQQRRASAPAIVKNVVPTVTDILVGEPTPVEETKDLVKFYLGQIWNRGHLDLIPQICSPDIRMNGSDGSSFDKIGHEGLAQTVDHIHRVIENYHCEVHCMVVEGNKAFCRLQFSGKHTGSLLGFPGTGKRISWTGASEFTCVDGRILKVWELIDLDSLRNKLQANALQEALEDDEDYHRY
ncbi:SnoaL-like polyketide cyclase [Seminavis robusta]|uniref:SnoaL-like polyketide cyclase n=1 Tax=Seminavis robusta TaxID=568900 RepID=A0A9N8EAW4_9STRA|nr:SnoaL-like polyketide cyclase [Seminavis robusta]|eukprot:Sro902_g218110.1 SnoaL-like polyketide cyclase (344) ;mRNA; f:3471-4696